MKKYIITLAACLMCCAAMKAQDFWAGAGFASCFVKEADTKTGISETFPQKGFFVGGEYELELTDAFSIAPGINFCYLTYKEDFEKQQDMSISVPVLFRAGYDVGGSRVFGNIGPRLMFALSDKTITTVGSKTITYDAFAVPDESRFNLGVDIGAGVEIRGSHKVFVDYTLGLLNTSKVKHSTCRYNSFVFGAAYCF